MILCEITADWVSAIISGIALLGTVYALWSTRKDSDSIQKQVNSLAKMASLYQKNRRDEIMANIVIDDEGSLFGRGYVIYRNTGKTAFDFKVISFEIPNILTITQFEQPRTLLWNQSLNTYFNKTEDLMVNLGGQYSFISTIQFRNSDGEYFNQKIVKNLEGFITSYPPIIVINN